MAGKFYMWFPGLGPKRICLKLLRDNSYLLATAQRRFLFNSICFETSFDFRCAASICFYLYIVPLRDSATCLFCGIQAMPPKGHI